MSVVVWELWEAVREGILVHHGIGVTRLSHAIQLGP